MEDFDTELMIDAIKSKPELWDCGNEDYKHRQKKIDAWNYVCALVVPGFEEKSDIEKNKIGKELQTRWRSIRDRHTRYLREIKKTKSGSAAKAKKNYIYAKHLDFLQSTVPHNVTQDSQEVEEDDSDNNQDDSNHFPDDTEVTPDEHGGGHPPTPSASTLYRRQKRKLDDKFEKYLELVTQRESDKKNDEDEDKAFFLSLIPNVKRLNEGDKLLFKSEVMQLLISYTNKPQLQQHQYPPAPPYLGPAFPPAPPYLGPGPACPPEYLPACPPSNVQTPQYSAPNSSYRGSAPPQNFHNVFKNQSQGKAQGKPNSNVTQEDRNLGALSPADSNTVLSIKLE